MGKYKKILKWGIGVSIIVVLIVAIMVIIANMYNKQTLEKTVGKTEKASEYFVSMLKGDSVDKEGISLDKELIEKLDKEITKYYSESSNHKVYIDYYIENYEYNLENAVDSAPEETTTLSAEEQAEMEEWGVEVVDLTAEEEFNEQIGVELDLSNEYITPETAIKEDENGRYIMYSDLTFIEGGADFEFGDTILSIPRREVKFSKAELPYLEGYKFNKVNTVHNEEYISNVYKSVYYQLNIKWKREGNKLVDVTVEITDL